MIEQILDFIHNYFIKEVYRGKFQIVDGNLSVDFLQENQYFKIVGSVFNDGVYKFSDSTGLTDEEFTGEVWAMAVPPSLVQIADEIEDWVNKYGDVVNSPYSSESFGGYSYTKAQSSGSGNAGSQTASWQSVFASRLNHWRKIS